MLFFIKAIKEKNNLIPENLLIKVSDTFIQINILTFLYVFSSIWLFYDFWT